MVTREGLEAEVKELRENQLRLSAAYHELDNWCDRYTAALAAVREVHHSSTTLSPPYGPGYEVCEGCGWHTGTLGPCPTIAAIDRVLQEPQS